MAEYSNLSATINAQIRANGVQAITGPVLNAVLTAMVNVLGDGYRLNGVAVPADNPGSPDNRVAYLAAQDGTYTNFGGLTISGEVALLLWDSVWTKATLFSIDTAVTPGSGHLVTSGAVDSALTTLANNIAAAYMQLVPAATEGNLAEFDNAGQVRDAGLATSDLATKDGHYPDLFAGFAGNLVDTRSAGTRQGPFAFRQSGGDGVNYMRKILGRTEAFNQLFDKSKAYGGTYRDVVITANSDGSYTFNGVSSGGEQFNLSTSHIPLIAGHSYLLTGGKSNDLAVRCSDQTSLFDTGNGLVWTAASSGLYALSGRISGGVTYNDTIYVKVVDLTLMYGAGNAPATAAAFRALHPLPYYAYNAGVLKNNAATGLETVGFNQWDEEWELGVYAIWNGGDGTKRANSSAIRSKNYIPCFGNTIYYAKGSLIVGFFDYDKNYLGDVTQEPTDTTFTTPANAAFMVFYTANTQTTYNHDICINRSDASRNGTYEPYWKRTLALGLNSIPCHDENNNAVVVNGLDGVGTSYDEPVVENGYVTKIIKRFAEVDMGDLSWVYNPNDNQVFSASVNGMLRTGGVSLSICSKYKKTDADYLTMADKEMSTNMTGFSSTAKVLIKDSAYSDATTLQAALAGVKLRFELATPKVLTLDNPIPALIEVDNLGTEKRLPEDTAADPQAPFECDSNYSVSTANLVRLLNL